MPTHRNKTNGRIHHRPNPLTTIAFVCLFFTLLAGCTASKPQKIETKTTHTNHQPTPAQPPPAQQDTSLKPLKKPTQTTTAPPTPALPGITLHLEQGFLDLSATVVGQHADWLELVACTPGSREHEALVTIDAMPSDLHLALLMLGIQPGQPQRAQRTDAGLTILPATGGTVTLDFITPATDDQPERIVAAGAWVLDLRTGQPLNTRHWMFTGSRLMTNPDVPDGPPEYLADLNGTVASLVHFGDETLGIDTTATQDSDGQQLAPNPDAMPADGTRVALRISTPQQTPK